MKLESLKSSKFERFEALEAHSLAKIAGGQDPAPRDGSIDTPATTGTNPYDSGEKEHGKATSDCIVFKGGAICEQEFWHADGVTTTWSQC